MTTHDTVLARLAALKAMGVKELQAEWQVLYGASAPNNSLGFLRGRLAYRIQELTYGGPDRETRRTLDLLADEVEGTLTRKRQIEAQNIEKAKAEQDRLRAEAEAARLEAMKAQEEAAALRRQEEQRRAAEAAKARRRPNFTSTTVRRWTAGGWLRGRRGSTRSRR